jgi:hypothetical protein
MTWWAWALIVSGLMGIAVLAIALLQRGSDRLPAPMLLVLRITLGIIFALLGVIGSFLPIMQGWLFFLLAALVLFPQSSFAVKTCNKIEPKMPRLIRWLRSMGIGLPREARGTMPLE